MEKNKETNLDGFNKPFAKTLRDLLDGIGSPLDRKVSQKELADRVEVSRQVISQYCNGNTSPNVETLKNIAEFFNVSCDYLTGMISVPSTDIDDKAIHLKTGLSYEAIKTLKDWHEEFGDNFLVTGKDLSEFSMLYLGNELKMEDHATINFLLSNKKGRVLLSLISNYLYGDYVSDENKEEAYVSLYNKKLGYNRPFNTRLIKTGLLAYVQSTMIECEKDINNNI